MVFNLSNTQFWTQQRNMLSIAISLFTFIRIGHFIIIKKSYFLNYVINFFNANCRGRLKYVKAKL